MNTRKHQQIPAHYIGVLCCSADTACAIERPNKKESVLSVLLAVVIALSLCAALYAWAGEKPVNEPTPCGENGVMIDGKCHMKNGKKVKGGVA